MMRNSIRRFAYRCVLRLHPPSFQREFAGEMLWIFDEVAAKEGTAPLFVDGLVSLGRQWALRGGLGELLAREVALAPGSGASTGWFAWEHIGVSEARLPISRVLQGSALAVLFVAALWFAAIRPVRSHAVARAADGQYTARQRTARASGTNMEADSSQQTDGRTASDSSQAPVNGVNGGVAGGVNGGVGGERQTAQEDATKTQAARQFNAWLEAFNSGESAKLKAFDERNYPDEVKEVDGLMRFRKMTGGFEVKKIEKAEGNKVLVIMKERNSDQFARASVEVEEAEPQRITALDIEAIPAPAEFAPARMSEEQAIAALRAEIEKEVAADQFAGAVMVTRNGKTIFSGAYGLADREKKIKNELNTRFRIGSMNKMFTAVSVLQLAQSGKIKLTGTLGEYLPDYPNKEVALKVTIYHLLTHTGGTGDFFGPEFDAHRLELRTLQDYVKLYGNRGFKFEPGSKWEYSNYGFLLLGVIVEKVSGQSYYDYVREHVYKPAGMTSTDSLPEDQNVPLRSVGYTKGGTETWKPNTDTLPYRGTSAGGGYSTVEDLQRFAEALRNHKLLDEHYTELLTTGKVDTGNLDKYAYGFMDRTSVGVRSFGHGGGAPGMNGDLTIYPQSGYVVTLLANIDPPAAGRLASFIGNRLPKE
jgi:CubicO group peptidase (beta-lactamase class C family)